MCTDAEGKGIFFGPRGTVLASAPSPPSDVGPDPVSGLITRNRERGIAPDWRSGMPDCRRDREVPWEVEAAALEALEGRVEATPPAAVAI